MIYTIFSLNKHHQLSKITRTKSQLRNTNKLNESMLEQKIHIQHRIHVQY